MAFIIDKEELKSGLIIFRRGDVTHRNFYFRIKLPKEDRYKTISLHTADKESARERAFDQAADIRFRVKHDVAVFNRPFRQVAEEYLQTPQRRADTGEVSVDRVKNLKNAFKKALEDYVGSTQIHLIGQDRWAGYPTWRRENGKGRFREHISDSTIAFEMGALNAVMNFAITKRLVPASHRFEGRPKLKTMRRDEFTIEEYRKLHSVGRKWLGVPLLTTDATGAPSTTPNDYLLPGFPGQSRVLADLYYNRYRDYDPTTGRYIQADPIGLGGGSNVFAYAGNNPVGAVDPLGLDVISILDRTTESSIYNAMMTEYLSLSPEVRNRITVILAHGNEGRICESTSGPCHDAKWFKDNFGSALDPRNRVVIWACSTGSTASGFAQQLANHLRSPVQAPTALTYWNRKGFTRVENPDSWFFRQGRFETFVPTSR